MKTNHAPEFRTESIALATKIPTTSIEAIVRAGLSPSATSNGRGSARRYTSQGLAHWAVIGGLCKAGIPALVAAKIAESFVTKYSEHFSDRGHLHDSLENHQRKAHESGCRDLIPEIRNPNEIADRFLMHLALNQKWPDYQPGVPVDSDMILTIADQSYLYFSNKRQMPTLTTIGAQLETAGFRILGWERGSKSVDLISIYDESKGDTEREAQIESEFQNSLKNASAVSRVNISLAIRNAYHNVAIK
jgi:hypothetical protein